nr:hypothetical protein B0A51_13608 [Rachicladosporium sp. CCFEE 5018]
MNSSTDVQGVTQIDAHKDSDAVIEHAQNLEITKGIITDPAPDPAETSPSAAHIVFGIMELTEKILASGLGMQHFFALKRINKHFHNCITGSLLLSEAMYLTRVKTSLGPWDDPYDFTDINMNPFLHSILSRYCEFDVEEEEPESAAPSHMDLHLDIHRKDLPNLVKRLDDALAVTKHWHETLVAEMSPFRIILIRCYSITLGGCFKCDTTTIEFICEHDTVGGLLREIRHQWGPNGEEKTYVHSPALHSADHKTPTSSSNTEATDTMASLQTSSAVGKVFSIVELTERILVSGIDMPQLVSLKRVNKYFHEIITGSMMLKPAMFLSYRAGEASPRELIFNPMLVSALSPYGRCDAMYLCSVRFEHTFDGFPDIIRQIDQYLHSGAPWLEMLATDVETEISVTLERGKSPHTQWAFPTTREFVIFGGESVGDVLREIKAQADKIQAIPESALMSFRMNTTDPFEPCYEKRITGSDRVRALVSKSRRGLMASLFPEGMFTRSDAQG